MPEGGDVHHFPLAGNPAPRSCADRTRRDIRPGRDQLRSTTHQHVGRPKGRRLRGVTTLKKFETRWGSPALPPMAVVNAAKNRGDGRLRVRDDSFVELPAQTGPVGVKPQLPECEK